MSVNFGLLNARSVVSKAAHIHDVISDSHLDVLAVTETWVTSDAPDAIKLDVAPPGYQVIHQPRGSSTDKRGGGVAVVHLDSISVRPFDVGTFSEFEALAVKLSLQSTQNIVVVCLYRPPGAVSQTFCCQLADLLDQLILADQRFVLCGDFNCPGEGDNHISSELHDVLQRYNLLQHVHEATHTGGNTLDLLLTPSDDASLVSEVSVRSTCFSDHHVISSRLCVPWHRPTVMHSQFRDLRRIDLTTFHEDVRQSPLYLFNSDTPVDYYVDLFNDEINRILEKHAPLKKRTRRLGRNDCRWLSDDARSSLALIES